MTDISVAVKRVSKVKIKCSEEDYIKLKAIFSILNDFFLINEDGIGGWPVGTGLSEKEMVSCIKDNDSMSDDSIEVFVDSIVYWRLALIDAVIEEDDQ